MPALSKSDLIAALSLLSPAERAALTGGGGSTHGTPKFSPSIDAIPDDRVEDALEVLVACTNASGNQREFAVAVDAARAEFPELMGAADVNARYRKKPLEHSLNVAQLRLLARKVSKRS